MNDWIRYFRYALRQLKRNPGFTLAAVLTLALGIGASTAIYTMLYATLLAPMPYPHPEQLVMVWSKIGGDRNEVSAGDFLDWKRQNSVFQQLSAWSGEDFNLSTPDHPEVVSGQVATPGWFSMQGFRFFLGRDVLPEEGEPGKDHEVVLTHRLWERLGANRAIIGQPIRMNAELYTVVGVLEPGVADRLPVDLSVPLAFKPEQINHNFHWLDVMGRMKPGVSLAAAQADMEVVGRRISRDYPESTKSWSVRVEPLRNDFIPRRTILTLQLLMGAVGFVLLIACANLANLLLAKAGARQKEVAIRSSLGASRRELFTQFMIESLLLAALGSAVGVGFAQALLKGFIAIMPPSTLPSDADIRIDLAVLAFTVAVTVVSAILFGWAPAWQAAGVDPNTALKEGGSAGTSAARHRSRRVLVVGEFALALVLLTSAGLAIHSFWNLTQVDFGVRRDHVLHFFLPVPQGKLHNSEEMVAFYRQLLGKLESLPGVLSAEAATGIPIEGPGFGKAFSIVGQPISDPSSRPDAGFQMVTPRYFETFGIRIVQGRAFTGEDTAGATPVAMVNEDFVRHYLSGSDPLRQRIAVDEPIPGVPRNAPPVERQIVGVFRNVRARNFRNQDSPEIYVPFWQAPWPSAAMAVRTSGDPGAMTGSIAGAVASLDRDLPVTNVRTMGEILSEVRASDRFLTVLYATFAAFALLLAAVGIYGVMAFVVGERAREIGLRMALGAGRANVLAMIVKEGLTLAVAGSGFGLIGALFVGRAMTGMLYEVGAVDIRAFAGVALVLLVSALLACYIPARRAANLDPMVALRYE